MSTEDSTDYTDAKSDDRNSHATDSGSSSDAVSKPFPKVKPRIRSPWRSESFFLALLFALIALLLPTFFSFATPGSDRMERGESPLKSLLLYVPTIQIVFRLSFSALQVILRPLLFILSLFLTLLAPVFLAVNLLYKAFVLLPSRIAGEVARFLYPVYLFCGAACLFGVVIGLGGRLVVEGSKWMLVQNPSRKQNQAIRND